MFEYCIIDINEHWSCEKKKVIIMLEKNELSKKFTGKKVELSAFETGRKGSTSISWDIMVVHSMDDSCLIAVLK